MNYQNYDEYMRNLIGYPNMRASVSPSMSPSMFSCSNIETSSDDLERMYSPEIRSHINSPYDYWISINQVNLLKNMNLVWLEHILWTRMLLISIAENLADLEPTKARLLENPKDIANVFKQYYGNNVANTIQKLLTEHLVIGADLIVALKNGNQKLAQELNTKWYKNADEMADSFSSINPFYPMEEIRGMLYEHLRLTTDEVSARLKKNYAADIKAYDMVQNEILRMSEFFVNGIVKQFPNIF